MLEDMGGIPNLTTIDWAPNIGHSNEGMMASEGGIDKVSMISLPRWPSNSRLDSYSDMFQTARAPSLGTLAYGILCVWLIYSDFYGLAYISTVYYRHLFIFLNDGDFNRKQLNTGCYVQSAQQIIVLHHMKSRAIKMKIYSDFPDLMRQHRNLVQDLSCSVDRRSIIFSGILSRLRYLFCHILGASGGTLTKNDSPSVRISQVSFLTDSIDQRKPGVRKPAIK